MSYIKWFSPDCEDACCDDCDDLDCECNCHLDDECYCEDCMGDEVEP